MPGEHRATIAALSCTIATIDGRRYAEWGREQWKKEIVHRWAHTIQAQTEGTIVRYGLTRPRARGAVGADARGLQCATLARQLSPDSQRFSAPRQRHETQR